MPSKRFVLVEDEAMLSFLLTDMLEELGHRVAYEASTLEAALQMATDGDFDAAIIDTNLHGKRAFRVAELLARKGTPFFFQAATVNHICQSRRIVIACWRSRSILFNSKNV